MAISREVKVGLFVLVGLIITTIVVFMIGDERRLFARHVDYKTAFTDVQGLKAGAPVRMNGIDVGTVLDVYHSKNLTDPRIYVDIRIVRDESIRMRKDAFARVINKGLLGDKMLEVVPGSGDQPQLAFEAQIPGEDPTDFSSLASQIGPIAEKTNAVLGNLEKASQGFADKNLQADVRESARSVNIILKQVAEGDGYAHRLLADPGEAQRLSRAIANFDKTSAELVATATELRQVVTRINQGPGFAHDVVYSEQGTQTLASFGNAAGELATTLKGVREGNGLVRGLIYGDSEQQQILGNLNSMSRDMKEIVANMKAGKGTVGALLVDPSVYEDMKMVLGNVERNDVLRALVRYSIKQDEKKPQVEIKDPAPASSAHR